MELDELRTAWQALGRQLERHDALQLRMHRSDRLDAARRGLRPLVWGQALQIAFGLALLLLGLLVVVAAGGFGLVQCGVERHEVPTAAAVAAQVGDADVQRHPVHPGGDAARGVVARPGAPQFGGDLLREVLAVFGAAGIGAGDFVHDAAVALQQRGESSCVLALAVRGDGVHPGGRPFECA